MKKRTDDHKDTDIESGTELNIGIIGLLGSLKTFKSFKTPVYRIYYGSMAGQWAVQSMLIMTNALLVYRLTGSGTIIGLVTIAQGLPQMLIALFGGAIADRIQKKYILMFSQISLSLIAFVFATAFYMGYVTSERWWLILILALCEGSLLGFLQPASFSIIPEIVGGNQVMNAISLGTMGNTFFRLIGPSLAGFLIDTYGFFVVYYLMCVLYIMGWIFASFLPNTNPLNSSRKVSIRSTLADMGEGLYYLRHETAIMLILIFGLLHIICGMPFLQLMSIFTEDILKVGATGLGILSSVSGLGALLSSLVMASLPNRKRGIILLLSGVIMGVAVMVFSWSRFWYLSLAMMPFTGVGTSTHMTMTATLIQYYVKPEYRGRMQSFMTMSGGLACVGTFLAGVLTEIMGVQWAVGGMAMTLTVISFLFMIFASKLTSLQ